MPDEPTDDELKEARGLVDEEIRKMHQEGAKYLSETVDLSPPQLPELDEFKDVEAWQDAEITSLQALRAKGPAHWKYLNGAVFNLTE